MLGCLVLALALAACSSTPAAGKKARRPRHGSGIVTPGEARRVVTATMATNNRANAKLDSSLLSSYETGSAFTIDDSSYSADRAAGYHPPPSPFVIRKPTIGLARYTSWPAEFVVEGEQRPLGRHIPKEPVCGGFLVFRRAAPSGRWQIFLEPSADLSETLRFAPAGGGYMAPAGRTLERDVSGIPSAFTRDLLHEELTGGLGPFTRSDFQGSCWSIPNPREDVESAEATGFSQRDLYHTVFPPDTTTIPLTGSRALVIFTVDFVNEMVEGSPQKPIGWTRPRPSADPGLAWTYFLAAGGYRSISVKGELEVAVVYSEATKRWSVVGSYSGVTAVSGVPAGKTSTTVPTGTLDTDSRS